MMQHDRYRTVSISRRHDRPKRHWLATWTGKDESGRWRRHRKSFPTKEIALQFKAVHERRINSSMLPKGTREWDDLIAEYSLHVRDQAKATKYFTYRALASFALIVEPGRLCDIDTADCERYFAGLSAGILATRRATPAALRQDYIALHAFFECFKRRKYISDNPMDLVEKPRLQAKIIELPPMESVIRLLEVLPNVPLHDAQAWHILILLGVVTGIDRNDFLKIRLDRPRPPEFEPFTFILGDAETDQFGLLASRRLKTGKPKLYGLPPAVCDRIARRISDLPVGTTHLFPWLNFPRNDWDRIRSAAGWLSGGSLSAWNFATLRKICGTQEIENAFLERARAKLDHSSARTTRDHYVGARTLALTVARSIHLPALPPLPVYAPVPQRRGIRAPRPAGSAPSAPR